MPKQKIELPFKGMKTIPKGSCNPILAGAFVGLVRFALNRPEIIKEFERDTLKKFLPNMLPVFADWVNKNMWDAENGGEF